MGIRIAQVLFDIFYPIGSYYETSDTSFNPNTDSNWYGTWVEDTQGEVLVSRNSDTFSTVGNDVGEEKHQLTVSEMPSHRHTYVYTKQITDWTSRIPLGSNVGTGTSTNGIDPTGGDQPHNNIQPSKVCIRWHRTA